MNELRNHSKARSGRPRLLQKVLYGFMAGVLVTAGCKLLGVTSAVASPLAGSVAAFVAFVAVRKA